MVDSAEGAEGAVAFPAAEVGPGVGVVGEVVVGGGGGGGHFCGLVGLFGGLSSFFVVFFLVFRGVSLLFFFFFFFFTAEVFLSPCAALPKQVVAGICRLHAELVHSCRSQMVQQISTSPARYNCRYKKKKKTIPSTKSRTSSLTHSEIDRKRQLSQSKRV